MSSSGILGRRTFAAFGVRNFRLYFSGQLVSVSGTWMQRVAQSWLVLEITGSGAAVGALIAVQFLPLLVLSPTGGLIADRMEKRKLLYITQSFAGIIALTLGGLVLLDAVQLWMVFVLAGTLGVVGAFDNPARQTFVMDMVGRSRLTNAVALNSILVNSARIIGPAFGGFLIVTVGIGWCFVLNAATYPIFIVALLAMHKSDLNPSELESRQPGQLRDALRYIREQPVLLVVLVMSAVFGMFAYEFEVVLPLLARFTYGGDADTFGTMFAAMGVGAVVGGFFVASRRSLTPAATLVPFVGLMVAMAATAVAPSLWVSYATLILVGATSTAFLTMSNSVLQLESDAKMRGRVMGLRAMAVLGARPIGAPIVGWIGGHLGPRYSLWVGVLSLALVTVWASRRMKLTSGLKTSRA